MGARILRKMGWRLGQGIGPRITYKQLLEQEGDSIGLDRAVDEEAAKHLYAPRDTKLILYFRKENAFGLGYVPGQGLQDIVDRQGAISDSGPLISGA